MGRIAVKIDNEIFEGKSITDLFSKILRYLVDNEKLKNLKMPWGKSNTRYIITNKEEPIHPTERKFFVPVSYKNYSMDAHVDRKRGVKILDDLCNKLEIDSESIDV